MLGRSGFSALDADNVVSLFQRGRSAALELLLATQGARRPAPRRPRLRRPDDWERRGPDLWAPERARLGGAIARAAGTREVPIHTIQTERPMGLRPGGYREAGRGSKRLGEEFIVHPNEIKALGVGEAVVISKNPHRVRVVRVAG